MYTSEGFLFEVSGDFVGCLRGDAGLGGELEGLWIGVSNGSLCVVRCLRSVSVSLVQVVSGTGRDSYMC